MSRHFGYNNITNGLFNISLPLWSRVIFVDWHGVLCEEVFWSSILKNDKHPYFHSLDRAIKVLFTEQEYIVKAWMRGDVNAEEVLELIDVKLDQRCRDDYLIRRLKTDCRKMRPNKTLLNALRKAGEHAFIVLATDNMDCFLEQIQKINDLGATVQSVLCSAALGVLKSESVTQFFGPWLQYHKLDFSHALLLDDNEAICTAFRRVGGEAILVKHTQQVVEELNEWSNIDVRNK